MKICVATDMEGTSGVFQFAQVLDTQTRRYHEAAEYMMGDIAAVVKGLRDTGVDEVYVLDGHGTGGDPMYCGSNFIPHLMEKGARYCTGRNRSNVLDKTFDGLICLGYHAMQDTPKALLVHTQDRNGTRYWYNGVESGELAQSVINAGFYDIPVIMVSGDDAVCREARKFFGEQIVTVEVKKALALEAAVLYPLEEARLALYDGVRQAVAALPHCKPYKLQEPIQARKEYYRHDERWMKVERIVEEKTLANALQIYTF